MSDAEQLSLEQLGEEPSPRSEPLPAPAPPPGEAAEVRTEEQAAAVGAHDPYVFVEAGAGTGKTGVLVERYCNAVSAAERGADAVLAFTFTEKAAGELRARVRAELRRRAASAERAGDAERARELRTLARDPGAWVTTIHGFCRRLVAAHPLAAGVDPGFRVLDGPEADLLAERAFEAAFEELLADPGPSRLALAAARPRFVLRELVRGAHDELRSLGRERPSLDPLGEPDLSGALDALAEAAREALAETADAGGPKAPELRERVAAAAALAGEHRDGPAPEVDQVLGLVVNSGGAEFKGPAVAGYNTALARAVERLAADLYEALRDLVEIYGRRYAELKAERSGLDFEDLQLRAVALLRDSEPIRDAYRERFGDVLVDEFQDTNRLQVALIELLRGPASRLFTVGDEFQSIYGFRHADVSVFRAERERARPLPLSGNFRSVPSVLAAANALGGALLPGYRPLVAALPEPGKDEAAGAEMLLVERAGWDAEDVGLSDRGELDAPAERVAEAAALARRLAELAAPSAEGGAGIARGEMVVLLRAFTHVTAYEEALERAGLRPLVVGGRGYWSQQQVEDMLCLLGVVANPLDDEALLGALAGPAAAVSPDALWLLRSASGRGRHLWPTVERTFGERAERAAPAGEGTGEAVPEAEADPERAAELERRREAAASIPEEDAERLRVFARRIAELRRQAPLLPLDSLVDETARALGYDLAVLQRDRGPRRWANVRKLMRLARAFEGASGRDLGGFVASLRARTERDEREPEAQTEVEGHDGVRLMTVHNAKGLEFGVVAVADLGRDLGAGGFPPAFRARPADDGDGVRIGVRLARAGSESLRLFELEGLAEEASVEESAEDRRLAYVAATRAERRLILSGVVDPAAAARCAGEEEPKPRTAVLYRLMREFGLGIADGALTAAEGAAVAVHEPGRAAIRVPAPETLPGVPAPAASEIGVRLLRPEPGIGRELLAPLPATRLPAPALPAGRSTLAIASSGRRAAAPGHLSNAALELYSRCGYRFYVERILGLRPLEAGPGSGTGEALAFGTAVHSLLEWSARNRWLEPPRERCERALARSGLEPEGERTDRARDLVGGWLASPLHEELAGAQAALAPEAPFLLDVGGAVVRGKLDLLASAPAAGSLVVDYKTNALDGREPADLMPAYETQRDLYALAAASEDGGGDGALVRTAFVFLERPDEPVLREHDAAELAATRERLEGLVAGIASGGFEVTDSPHRALCGDCPAWPRLCSHPPERTQAETPPGAPPVGAPREEAADA